MNEDLLAASVDDWLKGTDARPPDPTGSRSRAVARARHTRQVRSWSPGVLLQLVAGRSLAAYGATAAVSALAVGLLLLLPRTTMDDEAGSLAGASAGPESSSGPIHWQTDVVDLRTDRFALDVNGLQFTTLEAPLILGSDPGDPTYWTLEVEWWEHGVGQRLNLYFAADDADWWVSEIRTYDGYEPGEWVYAYGPFFTTPLGESFEGDVSIELLGEGRPRDAANIVEAAMTLDGLRLAVSPGDMGTRTGATISGSQHLERLAQVMATPQPVSVVPTFITEGLRTVRDLFAPRTERPQPDEATLARRYGGEPVTIPYGDVTLSGRTWPDGTVRVLDDGAGNAADLVDKVVVTPDDTVWVARNKSIFALGQEGKYRPPLDAKGKRWRIIDMEARPDGALEVLTWRALWHFEDGRWEQLPTPPEIANEAGLEGYYPERMPDGSVWSSNIRPATVARWDDDHWTEWAFEEVMPETSSRLASPDGFVIDGADDGTAWVRPLPAPDGLAGGDAVDGPEWVSPLASPGVVTDANASVWVSPSDGPVALAWFDGTNWHEYTAEFIEGIVGSELDSVGDVLVAPDGVTWITFWRDDAQRYVVRIADGEWTSTSILDISRAAGLDERLDVQALAPTGDHGAVQLYQFGDPNRPALLWDGERAELLEFGPFIPVGETSDGAIWGVGRDRQVGLLMRPADQLD